MVCEPCFHGVQYLNKLFFLNDIGNHGVYVFQEGTGEDAATVGEILKAVDISGIVYFDTDTAAHDTDFFDARVCEAVHFSSHNGFNVFDFFHIIVAFKQFDGFERNGTGKGIAHESWTVHQCVAVIVAVETVEYFMVGHGDGMADVTSGEGFSENEDIRKDFICHKTVTGTPKTGGYFIKNQKDIILITQFSGTLQEGNVIHAHTACSLQKWFYNKTG